MGRDVLAHRQTNLSRVLRRGRRLRDEHLVLVVRTGEQPWPRLGLAVSKGAGNSPARARMRRLCREAFRSLRQDWPEAVDVVVFARVPWPDARLSEVRGEMARQMDKVRWHKV